MKARKWLVLGTVLAAGCGEAAPQTGPVEPADPGVVHIHGLGRDPGDGALLIATHTGLFRVAPGEDARPQRVGDDYQDTMGFTVVGPGRYLGSGHPGSVRDAPPFLGLIESRDGGRSWTPVSLRGEVDFHVLEASETTVYGFGSDFESREARFLRSDDGGKRWTGLTPPEPLVSLAIDPRAPRTIVASGEARTYLSRDGGKGWRQLAVPAGLLAWSREAGLVSAGLDGQVRNARDPDDEWRSAGRLPGAPAALEGAGPEVLAALHDGTVLSSRDRGGSWRRIVTPAG